MNYPQLPIASVRPYLNVVPGFGIWHAQRRPRIVGAVVEIVVPPMALRVAVIPLLNSACATVISSAAK